MDIKITGKNMDITDALRSYIQEKMSVLEKFDSSIALIDVEMDKNMHHRKGQVFHVRANVDIPGKGLVRSEDVHPDMYAAIDLSQKALELQLSHQRDKERNNRSKRKAGRETKDLLGWLKFWRKSE